MTPSRIGGARAPRLPAVKVTVTNEAMAPIFVLFDPNMTIVERKGIHVTLAIKRGDDVTPHQDPSPLPTVPVLHQVRPHGSLLRSETVGPSDNALKESKKKGEQGKGHSVRKASHPPICMAYLLTPTIYKCIRRPCMQKHIYTYTLTPTPATIMTNALLEMTLCVSVGQQSLLCDVKKVSPAAESIARPARLRLRICL